MMFASNQFNDIFWLLSDDKSGRYCFETTTPDLEWAKAHRCGVFYVVNELGEQRNEHGHLKHNANVRAPRASFIDFDNGTKAEQYTKIIGMPLQPSRIVESGRGYHVYWDIAGCSADLKPWRFLQHELAVRYGGDPACKDYARVMRVPGSWHCKNEPPVEVVTVEENDNKYMLSDLFDAFGIVYEGPKVYTLSEPSGYTEMRPIPPTVLHENFRHDGLLKAAGRVFRGAAPSEFTARKAALKAWYVASCTPLKDNWEQEVENVCEWISKQEWGI